MGKSPVFVVTSSPPLRLTVLVAVCFVSSLSLWKPAKALPILPRARLSPPQDDIFFPDGIMQDCDWIGMTKRSVVVDGSVQQEYLRCSSGRIKWLYPDGALRLTIRASQPDFPIDSLPQKVRNKIRRSSPSSDHRVCLTVDRKTFRGVNIYLQDKQTLNLIFASSFEKPVLAGGQQRKQDRDVMDNPLTNGLIGRLGVKGNSSLMDEATGAEIQVQSPISSKVYPTVSINNQRDGDTTEASSAERRCFDIPSSSVTLYLETFFGDGSNMVSVASEDVDYSRLRTRIRRLGAGAAEIVYDISPL